MLAIYSKLRESFMALFRGPKSIKLARSTLNVFRWGTIQLGYLSFFIFSCCENTVLLQNKSTPCIWTYLQIDKSTLTETTKTHCCLAISELYWKNQKFNTFIEILFLFLELWNLNFLLMSYGFLVALLLQKSQHSFWNTLYKGVYKKLV